MKHKDIIKTNISDFQLKLYVENVNLTVNYYKEYAGFNLIERCPKFDIMNSAKMHFKDNILLFEKAENSDQKNNKEINLQLFMTNSDLKKLYDNYKQKIRINRVLIGKTDQIEAFSIKDCDGNVINFQNN